MNRKLTMMALMLLLSTAAFSQGFKIGYTFIDGIVFNMPEMTQIQADLNVRQSQLASQINTKQTEIQNKINEYQAMAQTPNAAALVLREKENEIQKLQADLQDFSQKADENLAAKQAELFQPVYDKVQNAIIEVRKEKGYNMIINSRTSSGAQVILAADEADDITLAVLEKLGVDLPKDAAAASDSTASGNK